VKDAGFLWIEPDRFGEIGDGAVMVAFADIDVAPLEEELLPNLGDGRDQAAAA